VSVLLVATIYRCGEKVYPLVEPLAEKYGCDVLLLGQMSPGTPWAGDVDVRHPFYDLCKRVCGQVFEGATFKELAKSCENGKALCRGIDFKKYDLIIFDDNLCKVARGTPAIYRWAKHFDIPVVACPHGNREYDGYIHRQIGWAYDYSFVFGPKDCREWGASDKIFPGGVPSNDDLSSYDLNQKHILVIPNYTRKKDQKETGYLFFHEERFVESGVLELSEKTGCKIIVKEKSRFPKSRQCDSLRKALSKYPNVECIYDVDDDNQLIADSKYVVSAPSTLAFKSIQLGIPTAVLDGYGMIGSLKGFQGLVPLDSTKIANTLQDQEESGRDLSFIRDTLSGGEDFNATETYMTTIARLLK